MSEGDEGKVEKAPKQGVPGWHEDPYEKAAERLWDGSKWTSEVRGELPQDMPEDTGQGPSGEYKSGGAVRGWIRSRPILWVSLAALVAFIIGIAASATENSTQEDEIAEQRGQIASLEQQVEESKAAEDELAEQASDLKAQEKAVKKREEQVSQEEQIQQQSTIPDGIWQSGTDFVPGTYRAPGGDDCYWATLGSADTNDIVNNGVFQSNPTVEIDSPWFETDGCGEWEMID